MKNIILLNLVMYTILAAEPNPPVWPSSVKIIEPNDPTAQSVVDQVFSDNGGHSPSCHGQFSDKRYALLFKPGSHNVRVNVGYYTHVMGLGETPSQTKIQSVICENGDYYFEVGALNNFWRIAENFEVTPTEIWNGVPNSMLWAVSQASPIRRVVVNGNLQLFQYNYGDAAGYASGGFMADMTVTGQIQSGSQQQFISRNSRFGSWLGALWNYVFVGVEGAPGTTCSDAGQSSTYTTASTPIVAEKPFIIFKNGRYYLAVPNLKFNSRGPSTNYLDFTTVDFDQVYVARDTDSVETINAKLAQGLHLVLTPGQYKLTGSIRVTKANTVVLGLGLATLISQTGSPAIVVENVDGVRVASVLLQAGPSKTSTLIQWGIGVYSGSPLNPGIISDLFVRVGGPNDPFVQEVQADKMVQINSDNVILDDLWLWRADHYEQGRIKNSMNSNLVGIEVNGNSVIAYGLAVEHSLQDLVQWNGENGQVYFYQSEFPYDVSQLNYGDQKYTSYRVADSVTKHTANGVGVYSFFADHNVIVDSAIKVPLKPNVRITNAMSVFLNGNGEIDHIVNDRGEKVIGPKFMIKYLCNYQGSSQKIIIQNE